jgi:hypothetical protein
MIFLKKAKKSILSSKKQKKIEENNWLCVRSCPVLIKMLVALSENLPQ